jgi:hypothetical protein
MAQRSTSFKIPDDWMKRTENLLSGTETISQFCRKAFEEKVRRMESRDERARKETLKRDIEALRPAVLAILKEEK